MKYKRYSQNGMLYVHVLLQGYNADILCHSSESDNL